MTMTIKTNTTDRKAMAKAMAEELGTTAKYMGPPTFGYQVGDFIVDRDGNIEGEDFGALQDFLRRIGCFPEEETASDVEQTEPEAEPAAWESPDQVNITVPADDLTAVQMKNLIFMLYTKQYLIGKMTGGDLLSIPDTLIARLMEQTPETTADFIPLLDAAKEDGMTGFEFADGQITLTFTAHQDEPERNMVYAMLTARILKAAKEAIRVFPERQEPANEKYFARAWLMRIGYGGADSKAERLLLLKHLKGHSAFPNDEAAEKHKIKYAEIRKEKRLALAEEVLSND
uniref:Uncharacterized protein n=1 Tax=uncultured bacterium Contig160 TaxID=1393469 RepID=W0FHJ0_9BACT|nr:hypothetical protein [uncultured bacterium Contig160]